MANGLAVSGGVTYPLLAPDGSAAAPSYSFASDTDTGMSMFGGTYLYFVVGGTTPGGWLAAELQLSSPTVLNWYSGASGTGSADLGLARLAAASLRQGLAPSATPVAQTFTLGEASRPATDANVGGASGTIRSGLGTGTGSASSLIFQTPTLVGAGSGVQLYGTRLTVATASVTSTVPVLVPNGDVTVPGLMFASSDRTGIRYEGATDYMMVFVARGLDVAGVRSNSLVFTLNTSAIIGWTGGGSIDAVPDLGMARLAAASLRMGLAPNATPVGNTLTIGEASRPGTDANVGGGDGTIRSGLGTGTGTASSIVFQTPNIAGAGSGAQAYVARLTLSAAGAVFDIVDQGLRINNQVSGAAASAGTLTNAPSAGNPSFWLPINIAGNLRYIPCWT